MENRGRGSRSARGRGVVARGRGSERERGGRREREERPTSSGKENERNGRNGRSVRRSNRTNLRRQRRTIQRRTGNRLERAANTGRPNETRTNRGRRPYVQGQRIINRFRRIVIRGLPKYVTNRDLRKLISREGPTFYCNIFYDDNGYSTGTADLFFVRSFDAESFRRRWNRTRVDGKLITVFYRRNRYRNGPFRGGFARINNRPFNRPFTANRNYGPNFGGFGNYGRNDGFGYRRNFNGNSRNYDYFRGRQGGRRGQSFRRNW